MSCYCHHFFGADYLRGPGQSNKTTQIIPRGEKSTFFVRMKEKSDRVEKFTGLFRIKKLLEHNVDWSTPFPIF